MSKISLRKANALQLLINEGINTPFTGSVTITQFDNPTVKIAESTTELTNTIDKKFELIDVLFAIRLKVAEANASYGINTLLTKLAENEKKTAFFKQLASTTDFTPTQEQVKAKVAYIKKLDEASTSSYGSRANAFAVGLLSKDVVESYKKSLVLLRKEKQKIQDKLLNLNVTAEITLSDEEAAILQKYDIL